VQLMAIGINPSMYNIVGVHVNGEARRAEQRSSKGPEAGFLQRHVPLATI